MNKLALRSEYDDYLLARPYVNLFSAVFSLMIRRTIGDTLFLGGRVAGIVNSRALKAKLPSCQTLLARAMATGKLQVSVQIAMIVVCR